MCVLTGFLLFALPTRCYCSLTPETLAQSLPRAQAGDAVSLRPGEAARGWTLVSVEPGQATLHRGQELRRLPLGGR